MSGGQQQRLTLAQAILANPEVWILDEPVAGLEPETRGAITADLLAVTAGRSTLLITHDLDSLDEVDEIIVLDAGRVAERGTHSGLLRAGGLYRQLWDAHTSRPSPA
jgi:ABC-type multidrug transport system fused ATPase/permease subunit